MQKTSLLTAIQQLALFGVVGIAATAVHAIVGVFAVYQLKQGGLSANAIGFFAAWWVSFFGHYAFTFNGEADRWQAFLRFLPHSAMMFTIGMAVTGLVSMAGPQISQSVLPVIGACAVPLLSFISTKFFVFRV